MLVHIKAIASTLNPHSSFGNARYVKTEMPLIRAALFRIFLSFSAFVLLFLFQHLYAFSFEIPTRTMESMSSINFVWPLSPPPHILIIIKLANSHMKRDDELCFYIFTIIAENGVSPPFVLSFDCPFLFCFQNFPII